MLRLRFSSRNSAKLKGRRKGAVQCGAALVEGLIVISLLSLGLLGLNFFRDLYMKQMGVARLARASVMAYSMTGCEHAEPGQWLGNKDLGPYSTVSPTQDRQPATDPQTNQTAIGTDRAGGILQEAGGISDDGKGVVNPITSSDLSGQASGSNSQTPLGQPRGSFKSEVHSRSHVSCGDPIKNGDFSAAFAIVKKKLGDLF